MASDFLKSNYIQGKVFIVTGGAAGVGAGTVRALLAENARHVAFLDIAEREGSLLQLELINKFGALSARFIKCDVSDDEQLASAYSQVFDKYRRLDGVINNAAVLNVDETSYKRMIDVNFTATVSSTMKALDLMGHDKNGHGGVIVNISSLLALNLTSNLPVYAATKTAILQYSATMGGEKYYSKSQVRVLTVCLGPTDTAILERSNLENFNKDSSPLISRVPVRQRVESAVNGIIDVINRAESGTTWIIENDKPAYNFTRNIAEAYEILSTR